MTKIEWTEKTWNPIVGCSIVSPGCTNCYAMRFAGTRLANNSATPHYAGTTVLSKAGPVWTGKLALAPERTLLEPLRRKKPTMYFVNSMGDLFHEDCSDQWIDRVFAVMALCPQHTFQVLTKRSRRMLQYFTWQRGDEPIPGPASWILEEARSLSGTGWNLTEWPLPNVWLGVSAERQQEADERIPDLLDTPAAVRFVSAEPLLGPIDFARLSQGEHQIDALQSYIATPLGGGIVEHEPTDTPSLDWVIVGGESGPGARPMHPDWARSIRDQCQAAGVPFFFKQWGEWGPGNRSPVAEESGSLRSMTCVSSTERSNIGKQSWMAGCGDHSFHLEKMGKSRAGRLLDGREWNQTPRQPAEATADG